jgi:hypothetical protein
VGEGFIERMEKGTTAFVSYAVDGNVAMTSRDGTRNEGVRLLKIVDGLVVSEVLEIQTTTYDLDNRNPKPITAYVKTGRRTGWKLRNQPAETVVGPDALMVPAPVPAGGKAELTVEWVRKVERRERFNSQISLSLLDVYLRSGKAPPEVARKLGEAIKLKGQIDAVDKEAARKEKLHRDLSVDQERVREPQMLRDQGQRALRRELEAKMASQARDLGKLSGDLVQLSGSAARQANVLISPSPHRRVSWWAAAAIRAVGTTVLQLAGVGWARRAWLTRIGSATGPHRPRPGDDPAAGRISSRLDGHQPAVRPPVDMVAGRAAPGRRSTARRRYVPASSAAASMTLPARRRPDQVMSGPGDRRDAQRHHVGLRYRAGGGEHLVLEEQDRVVERMAALSSPAFP